MVIQGAVDSITTTEVRGWAFAKELQGSVLVQAVLNHEILGEAVANIYRADLAAAGLGDGKSGFVINMFRNIDQIYLPFIEVKVGAGDVELPKAPTLGLKEFFHTLYQAYPSTGRHRSVYGGLWTDRTDAIALLRGKMDVGIVTSELFEPLAGFIHDGYVLVQIENGASDVSQTGAIAERAISALEVVSVLTLLRAVLEDQPLIVKLDRITESETRLTQTSSVNPSPSPAECLSIILGSGGTVTLDVVRNGHCLPEFTPSGVSRWASRDGSDGTQLAAEHGVVESLNLKAESVAVIGPGTLARIRLERGAEALRVICLPNRGLPLTLAADSNRCEVLRDSGVKVWI